MYVHPVGRRHIQQRWLQGMAQKDLAKGWKKSPDGPSRIQAHTNEPCAFHGLDTQLVMARIIRIPEHIEQEGHDRPVVLKDNDPSSYDRRCTSDFTLANVTSLASATMANVVMACS